MNMDVDFTFSKAPSIVPRNDSAESHKALDISCDGTVVSHLPKDPQTAPFLLSMKLLGKHSLLSLILTASNSQNYAYYCIQNTCVEL